MLLLQDIVATTIIFSIEAIILIILAIMNLSANSRVIERAKAPKNDIKDYLNDYGLADARNISSIIYKQALGRNKNIVSKTSMKKRFVYTIVFSLLLFVALNVFYCESTLILNVWFLISLYFSLT